MSENHFIDSNTISKELHKLLSMADLPLLTSLAANFPSTSIISSMTNANLPSAFLPVQKISEDSNQQQFALLQLQMQLNALLPLLQHQIHLQQQQSLFPSISTTQSNSTIEALNLQLLQNQMSLSTSNPPSLLTDPAIFLNDNHTNPFGNKSSSTINVSHGTQISCSTLLPPKSPELRRRKRSRASAEPQISVLRQLCDDDDGELLKNAKAQSEEAINRSRITDSINLTQIHQHPSRLGIKEEPVLFNEERKPLRKIIKEEDLPETVGPDSPLRHHPKYFNQNRLKCPEEELLRGFETITTLFMMNGYLPDEMREQFNQRKIKALSAPASPTPISTNRTVKPEPECPIEDFMEQVISRELVTCE